ncbi:MFS transporter [Belnapia sp. T6]|uniref:MFS transporter n=1 Tax=Belnapia mucosa TaxID=2804532 RepID=A0ABS1V5C8_9PROT|nr:MFS transporter [Belnapia mucosa]MBL6456895.1 MFS transporter [Belnapia mucosa]
MPEHPLRRLFASPDFLRLWAVGGIANAMRWVEILVAGIATFAATGSAFAVSLVVLMRSLPMLLFGAVAGALAETLDRRRLLMAGQAATCLSAGCIALLAATGHLAVWHFAAASFLGGLVWTGEMASRRRMVTEVAGEQDVVPAVATDSLTANTTRMAGPLLGGLLYETVGVAAAYAVAACCYAVTFTLLSGVRHAQRPKRLRTRQILADVADGVRLVRRMPVLQAVILITLAMNIFGFCFTGVLPALGARAFGATPVQIGMLTAAEPAGALLTGLVLATRHGLPLSPGLMLGGGGFFMLCLMAVAAAPSLGLAIAVLMLGGIGTALFAALQTALPVTRAPAEARSRVLGLVTTCIGMGPLGALTIGALADRFGPFIAIPTMAGGGLCMILLSCLVLRR